MLALCPGDAVLSPSCWACCLGADLPQGRRGAAFLVLACAHGLLLGAACACIRSGRARSYQPDSPAFSLTGVPRADCAGAAAQGA